MPNVGLPELLVVLVIALVIFGPKKLPELGRSLGRGIREFRTSVGGSAEDEPDELPRHTEHHEPVEAARPNNS